MKKIFAVLFSSLILSVNAATLDFNASGDKKSNEILEKFITAIDEKPEIISHFYDIDKDGKPEILGIVKASYFYSLEGYRLFVLKQNDSEWDFFKSDIYFDNSKKITINNKKITYYKTIFYKNKKYKAHVKKNKIKSSKHFTDFFSRKKAKNIEEITKLDVGHIQNNFEIENFHAQKQKSLNFHYNNLDEKTKHYLEMK